MKVWIPVLLGLCGCLEDSLPQADVDMGAADSDQITVETLCEKRVDKITTVSWNEESIQVQCLKDYGGGWLLVARSGRTSAIANFGWLKEEGSLDREGMAYSLGKELRFTELLVVAGPAAKLTTQDFTDVVKIRVFTDHFISDNSLRSERAVVTMLKGACNQDDVEISAFAWIGQTARNVSYWFGEVDGVMLSATGLYPDGWRFRGTSCAADGNFGGQAGAVYVRAMKDPNP